jgi:transposase
MQGRKIIEPKMMYQVSLDTLVPKDNFYRQVNANLDLSFLYKETAHYYGSEGQESIDPVVFFKICLAGYLNNIVSDRKLIEFCSNRLDMRLYLQYDIDEALPWHSTISRTRQLFGEEVFLSLFRKVLSLCVAKGMVRGKRQAVDSAFVKANASLDSLVEKEVLSDVAVYAEELNQGSENQVALKKVEDTADDKQNIDKGATSNKTYYSPTDPDARISIKPGKPTQLNYYGQIAVDDAHHVITGAVGDFADQRDSQCFEKIAGHTIENLVQNGLQVTQLLADTGYSSGEVLRYIEENNLDAYIPNHGSYKHDRKDFYYNKELDRYECTRGNKAVLSFSKIVPGHDGLTKKVYLSSKAQCKDCPLRNACIRGSSTFKKLTDTTDKLYYSRMHSKMNTAYGKRMSRIRAKTVEPVLGTLINFTGMKRVSGRGIKQANKHVLMATLSYNLKKYLKFISKNAVSVMVAMKKEQALTKTLFYEAIEVRIRILFMTTKINTLLNNNV